MGWGEETVFLKPREGMNKQNHHLEKSLIAFITATAAAVLSNKYSLLWIFMFKQSIPNTF